MSVRIDRGPINPELPAREYEPSQWIDLMRERRDFIQRKISSDCRFVVQFLRESELMYQVCGFSSPDEMVEKGYRLDPEQLRLAVAWLELNDPEEAIGIERVLNLASHGGDRKSAQAKADQTTNGRLKYGGNTEYLMARLRRDRPDLAAKVEAGKLSANAAAIEAGFRHKTVAIRVDDVGQAVKALLKYFRRSAIERALRRSL